MYKHLAAAAALHLVVACAQPSPASAPNAIVTPEQYARSYGVIADMLAPDKGYVPFEYKPDGCYARALYLSLQLAAEGIPSSAMFAFQKPDGPALRLYDGVTAWSYHVAPMIKVGENGTETVIDPAMGQGTHLSLTGWLADMQVEDDQVNLFRLHGSTYATTDVTDAGLAGETRQEEVVASLADLRPFKASDVKSACQTLWDYLAMEPDAGRGTAARRETLISETGRLLKGAYDRGKLTEDLGSGVMACGDATVILP